MVRVDVDVNVNNYRGCTANAAGSQAVVADAESPGSAKAHAVEHLLNLDLVHADHAGGNVLALEGAASHGL